MHNPFGFLQKELLRRNLANMKCGNPRCGSLQAAHCCGSCGVMAYCSKACQRAHWSTHRSEAASMTKLPLCDTAHMEFMRTPMSVDNRDFDDQQIKIREHGSKIFARSIVHELPEATRSLYAAYPVYKFYRNHKGRPVRTFGVLNFNTSEPRLHTITLKQDGDSYFTVGGQVASMLTMLSRWDDKCLSIISRSKIPGVFVDPCGHVLAASLSEETGYGTFSGNLCTCCVNDGSPLPTDRPVLFSPDHIKAMMTTCDCCGKFRKGRLCGKCQKARYCSLECQAKAWPVHKTTCAVSNADG